MGVKITDNTVAIENDISVRGSIFLRHFADEVVNISTPNTPKKTGRLRMDVIKQVLGLKGKIKWGKGYAAYQEEKQFKNYTTAGTGPNFAKNAIKQAVGNVAKIASRSGLIKL